MDILGWKDVALAACGLLSLGAVGIAGWTLVTVVAIGNRLTATETKAEAMGGTLTEIKMDIKEIRRIVEGRA